LGVEEEEVESDDRPWSDIMKTTRRATQPSPVGLDESVLVREVEAVKRLLILLLVKCGSTSEEIASALGVDSSVVRKTVPSRSVKKLSIGSHREED
jgi:hypothetical protein